MELVPCFTTAIEAQSIRVAPDRGNIMLSDIKTVFKKNIRRGWVRTSVLNTACLRKALKIRLL